jgi:hypothetical protein
MRLLLTATAVVLVSALLVACGGEDEPGGERVSARGVPFTFILPEEFRRRQVRGSFSRGSPPLAVFALDPWNLVDVRRSAPRELELDAVAKQIGGSLRGLGFPNARGTREEHGGRDYVVFGVTNRIGGRRTTSRLYFFTGAGATWEIECQSTADKAGRVEDACDGAVRSVEFG